MNKPKGLKMTETMFERAAKSLYEAEAARFMAGPAVSSTAYGPWAGLPERARSRHYAAARAALQAIREPDDVLASKVFYLATSTAKAAEHEERFTAMIDSILSQSQEGKHP
jgi:hypothetical protein